MSLRRSPIHWPGGARIAFVVEVSYEAFPEDFGTPGSTHPSYRSPIRREGFFPRDIMAIGDRQFGERVGIFRLLDILAEEKGVKATFFTSGAIIETYPEVVREILDAGHELSGQNYRHAYPNLQTPEEHRQDLEKTMAVWEKVVGHRPKGFVTAGWWSTDQTPLILADLGIQYWMDPLHEEIPYTLRLSTGKELVAMPHGGFLAADLQQHGMAAPRTHRDLLERYHDCFDFLYEEGERFPSIFSIVLHPYAMRPHAALTAREFLRYVKGHPRVWLTTCGEIADWWLENYKDTHVELWPNYGTAFRRRLVEKG